jgi:predicted nucleic acid-binding Zn ribbon protein
LGGLIYESKEHQFLNGEQVLMRDEKQDATEQPGAFRQVVREFIGGVKKSTKTETVQPPS